MKNKISLLIYTILFLLNFSAVAQAQETYQKHSFNLELGGNSLFYSLGYSYFILPNLSIGSGMGYFSTGTYTEEEEEEEFNDNSFLRIANVPLIITYLRGESNHKLEIYGGVRFEKIESNISGIKPANWNTIYIAPNVGIGYRYEGKHWFGGVSLGLTRLAFLEVEAKSTFLVSPVIGIRTGFRF